MGTTITRASWMAWLAACAAAACSSSGGGGDAGTDAAPATAAGDASQGCPGAAIATLGDACTPCLMAECNAEQSAYAGPNWATEGYGSAGGACGGWFMCVGQCGCNDASCYAKCSMSSACQSAAMAVEACTAQNCSNACANMVTTDGGSGLCVYESDSPSPCPASGILGCCKTSAQELCFYPPATAAGGMLICSGLPGGVWSATP